MCHGVFNGLFPSVFNSWNIVCLINWTQLIWIVQMENTDHEQFLKLKRNKWNEEALINVGCRLKNIATIENIIRKEGKHKEFMSSCFKQFTNFPQNSLFSATVVHGVLLREIRIEGATMLWMN